jgi:hypothetical protein
MVDFSELAPTRMPLALPTAGRRCQTKGILLVKDLRKPSEKESFLVSKRPKKSTWLHLILLTKAGILLGRPKPLIFQKRPIISFSFLLYFS